VRGSGSVKKLKLEPDSDNFSDSEITNHELTNPRSPSDALYRQKLKIESDSESNGKIINS